MTLEETMLNPQIANMDLTKVAALQQKRTLAFVNHFMITTVKFLNSFMRKCEYKLMEFEKKLEKVEASMVLLEARLSSIPEVNTSTEEQNKQEETVDGNKSIENTDENQSREQENQNEKSEKINESTGNTIENNSTPISPEYERFVKMVQVGVPLEAVKLKTSLEGLDPNVLEKILHK